MGGIQFALIREGTSDDGLAYEMERLLAEKPRSDLIFGHRNSDSRDASDGHDEIASAAEELGLRYTVVAVVPIELNSWRRFVADLNAAAGRVIPDAAEK